MLRACDARSTGWAYWTWRVALFAALAAVILGLEQWFQSRWAPGVATALGIDQLRPGDSTAESLRTFEWARQALPIVAWGLVAVAGCVVFVPMPRRWVRLLRRTFE